MQSPPESTRVQTETRGFDLALAAIIVLIGCFGAARAIGLAFVQDDAFISFRYARNLAEHGSLVFNPGEYVEGYTNFLWVLLMAAGIALGVDPVVASKVLGITAWLGILLVTAAYGRTLLLRQTAPGPFHALPFLGLALLPLNDSSAAYATGGLSTALFGFGICLCLYLALVRPEPEALPGASASVALGVLCLVRPEAPLVIALVLAALTLRLGVRRLPALARWSLPMLAIIGLYACWKLWYFGALLPNTFHTKSASQPHLERGVGYVWSFVENYPYFLAVFIPPALVPMVLGWKTSARAQIVGAVAVPAILTGTLAVYVAYVGGDFMEYKPLMHGYPAGVLAYVVGSAVLVAIPGAVRSIAFLMLGGTLVAAALAGPPRMPKGVFNSKALQAQITSPPINWGPLGRRLGQVLPPDTIIGVGAAGAVPYYSRLYTIDLLGLTDAHVAHQAVKRRGLVGHEKRATDEYVISRGVNLRFSHWSVPGKALGPHRPNGRFVYIRRHDGRYAEARYLVESDSLTAWMREHPKDFVRTHKPAQFKR